MPKILHTSLRFFLPALVMTAMAAHAGAPVEKYKSNGPIEINADTLDVLQEKNMAIFTGNVVAIQGDVRLKAEKMTVHYLNPEEKKQKKEDQTADSIEKIEVEGGVFLSTPTETGSGARGVYDVANQKIILQQNVVLTRAGNVLKGDGLVYDFATGKSRMTSAGNAQGGKKERVRALLIPDSKDKEKDKTP